MKSITLSFLAMALLLANLTSSITLNHSDLIPLDKIDSEAVFEVVETFQNATDVEQMIALRKVLKGTVLEVGFLTEADTYNGPADKEASSNAIACTTNKSSPPAWKMIWAAYIVGAKPGGCQMDRNNDCTQFFDYQGAKILGCGNPAKYDFPCSWVMSYSLQTTTKCMKMIGGQSKASGKNVFGYALGKIPGTIENK